MEATELDGQRMCYEQSSTESRLTGFLPYWQSGLAGWETYDARCSACFLGHSHTGKKHIEAIALHECWGKRIGENRSWNDPRVVETVRAYVLAYADLVGIRRLPTL